MNSCLCWKNRAYALAKLLSSADAAQLDASVFSTPRPQLVGTWIIRTRASCLSLLHKIAHGLVTLSLYCPNCTRTSPRHSNRLSASDRITSTNDFNIDRPRHQVYIDDLNLFGPDADALAQLQSEYISAVASCGLPVKPSKVIAPSCDGVECIGLEVHGITHEVGVTIPKLEGLCRATQNSGIACIMHWYRNVTVNRQMDVAPIVSRPALSVFYAVLSVHRVRWSPVFDVWPCCVRELDTMVRLSPLFFATLENKWFGRVICADTSESGQGVVAARATSAQLRSWTKFGDRGDRNSYQAIHSTKWSTIVASPWQRLEHINTLECGRSQQRSLVAFISKHHWSSCCYSF